MKTCYLKQAFCRGIWRLGIGCLLCAGVLSAQQVSPQVSLVASEVEDQDDMCFWIHPDDAGQSIVITSDKTASKLFVYDLAGNHLQTLAVPGKPGNIDIRYNFPLGGQLVDIVGYNDRDNEEAVFYYVNPATRQLMPAGSFDAGNWPEEIYGFCLYHSPNDGKFYAFASGKSSQIRQWELVDNGDGTIGGMEKRTWINGDPGEQTEGMVADDEAGKLYAANEVEGIYKYDADPLTASPAGELIAPTGVNNFDGDAEGVTIYYAAGGAGYLIVSDQGSDNFKVFDRQPPHNLIKTFSVDGAEGTDGIDVLNLPLGGSFPQGLFALHNDNSDPIEVLLCDYGDLDLLIDTGYWHPRGGQNPTGLADQPTLPEAFQLQQNYPNPFNPDTRIAFRVPDRGKVKLAVFDLLGREVRHLIDQELHPGAYEVSWNGRDRQGRAVASGTYLYRLVTERVQITRKMQLLR